MNMTSDQKRLRRPDIVLIVMQHDHDYERGINDADKVGQPQPLEDSCSQSAWHIVTGVKY